MLIGVDHGNKQIKTVHCNPFVSGLKQSVTRPFGQNVLRYQNTYYTLSTERIPYRKDKTEDDRFFILTLFTLAGEIEARGAYSSEVQRIQLAVGLPPAHFGAQVERFTQYFGQRGMVEFESASNWMPSRRPLARRAPCCFIMNRKSFFSAGSVITTASPKSVPTFVPPM